jgi:hypothetical protein
MGEYALDFRREAHVKEMISRIKGSFAFFIIDSNQIVIERGHLIDLVSRRAKYQ